jgi:hypothetical protein
MVAEFQQDRLDSTASSNFPAKKHTQITKQNRNGAKYLVERRKKITL